MSHQPETRPRRRRKEARPQELLDAAFEVFTEKGFSAARLEEIAARAGVGKGTLYLYFPSKEALLEALIDTALLPNVERLEQLVAEWPGTTEALLRRIFDLMGGLMREGRLSAFPKLVIAEASNFPAFAERYRRRVIDRGLGLLAKVVARGIERGEFRAVDPAITARLCIAPFLLFSIWQTCFARFDEEPFDAAAFMAAHAEALLHGIAVPTNTEAGR